MKSSETSKFLVSGTIIKSMFSTLCYLVQQMLLKRSSMDILSHSSAWGALQGASLGIYRTRGGTGEQMSIWMKRRHMESESKKLMSNSRLTSLPISSIVRNRLLKSKNVKGFQMGGKALWNGYDFPCWIHIIITIRVLH